MSHPFRVAVEARDLPAMVACMADDATFTSPAVHRPYEGKAAMEVILRTVFEVFEDFRYVGEAEGPDGHVLRFRARVGDREVEGIDWLTPGPDGQVADLTVMVRPLSGLVALKDAMGARLAAG